MMGETLTELRARVESLARPDGSFAVVCARTGEVPVPVSGLRYPDRETAVDAATAARRYRATLRRYDPKVAFHDLVVQEVGERTSPSAVGAPGDMPTGGTVAAPASADPSRRSRFCHEVTAATFEALSATGHDAVEREIMDTYMTLADTTTDPDELCLLLLWSLNAEIARLPGDDCDRIVRTAASSLPPAPGDDPLEATCSRLREAAVVSGYTIATDPDRPDAREVLLEGYELADATGRFPTLPIAVEVLRHAVTDIAFTAAAVLSEDCWRLTVSVAEAPASGADGLVSLPAVDRR